MWKRFVQHLRCPVSGEALTLVPFKEADVLITDQMSATVEAAGYSHPGRDFYRRIDAGVLLAPSAGLLYPIARGVPLMHPSETVAHLQFVREFSAALATLGPRYRFPSCSAQPCEHAFLRSFNRSWADDAHKRAVTDAHEDDDDRRLLAEIGLPSSPASPQYLLEVGCGNGVATAHTQHHLKGEAVGVDLRFDIVGAAERFQANPLLHFVQASPFSVPFAPSTFDVIYSRGMLQHTHAPREALLALAQYCRPGGRFCLCVHGPGAAHGTRWQRVAYAAETVLRPILSHAAGVLGAVVLAPIALGSVGLHRLRGRRNGNDGRFTFNRALHSVRDRVTPRYAHRHDASEVVEWFREAGFESIEIVDGRDRSHRGHDVDSHDNVRGDRPLPGTVRASTVVGHL